MNDVKLTRALNDLFSSVGVSDLDAERCREFLAQAGWQGLCALGDADTIRNQLSISRAPAMKLAAAAALQNLSAQQIATSSSSIDDVAAVVRKSIHEQLYGLYWGEQCELLHTELLAVGNISSVPLLPYAALRPAFLSGARAFGLLHNHPSGNVEPSLLDLTSAQSLKRVAREVGIELLAVHVVTQDYVLHFPV